MANCFSGPKVFVIERFHCIKGLLYIKDTLGTRPGRYCTQVCAIQTGHLCIKDTLIGTKPGDYCCRQVTALYSRTSIQRTPLEPSLQTLEELAL